MSDEQKQKAKKADTPAGPPEMVAVKITHYKVHTSAGKLIEGQIHPLPADEAAALVAEGHAEVVGDAGAP